MKGNSNLLFTGQKSELSALGKAVFNLLPHIFCYGYKYDYARCGMQYKASPGAKSRLISQTQSMFFSSPTTPEGQPSKTGTKRFLELLKGLCLTLHLTISTYIQTLNYHESM